MIEIRVGSGQKFKYDSFFKNYFNDAGPGGPDPFEEGFIQFNYEEGKAVQFHGDDFYYNFQNHVVSGDLGGITFKVNGASVLSISGLDISNEVGQAGELHWLVAGLMGGGFGSDSDAEYGMLLSQLKSEAQHFIGGSAKDTYTGTKYADLIEGGSGKDNLKGAAGGDTFVFNSKLEKGNVDTIGDFVPDVDIIQLGKSIFGTLGMGGLDEDQFSVGGPVGDDPQIVYQKGSLYYFFDGEMNQFAKVGNGLDLGHDDFLVA